MRAVLVRPRWCRWYLRLHLEGLAWPVPIDRGERRLRVKYRAAGGLRVPFPDRFK